MSPLADLWAVLKGDGIALDRDEAQWLGNQHGQTISMWAAISNRHGSLIGHLVCVALFLVQWRHCHDQLVGTPMRPSNYIRAVALMILFGPVVFVIGCVRAYVLRLR